MTKATEKYLETDLYQSIHEYWVKQGYQVRSEVNHCDVTARKGEELVIIEIKRQFTIKLLMQAAKRQRMTDSVYVAVPREAIRTSGKTWKDICFLLRRLELGLMLVSLSKKNPAIEIVFHPAPFRLSKSKALSKKKKMNLLAEFEGRQGDYNIGGSTRRKLMTAYKQNAVQIACCLEVFGPLAPRRLREFGTGRKTTSILSKNFYGWFYKVDRGIYGLSREGAEHLRQFPELSLYFKNAIDHFREKSEKQKET